MILEHPWALALLVMLPVVVWLGVRSRAPFARRGQRTLFVTAQGLAATALTLAIAGPWVRAEAGRPTRIAVALPGADAAAIGAWRDATPHADPFRVIAAGVHPTVGVIGPSEVPAASGAPDVAAAIRAALQSVPMGSAGDVAVFGTAGHAGGPLRGLADVARATGVRVHARTAALSDAGPVLLEVRHPARVGSREPFRAEVDVRSSAPAAGTDATLRITADGAILTEVPLHIRPGKATSVIDVPPMPKDGVTTLEFALLPDGAAPDPARRTEVRAVLAEGSPRVLWLGGSDDAFAALRDTLAPHGLALERGAPAAPFETDAADAFDAVIVDDLPASAWPEDAQRALTDAVVRAGTGVLLAGARRSLGPGGYADSPLATILPVDLPQREERRDPSVALVLVIDTSGSMGNRIELAKEVARLALRRLLPHDKAGIVEFYGSKRWAAPLQPASNTIELSRALNRMQAGGGTVIYSALEESYYALLNVQTRFKHILVLTDGGVESGPFETLARRIASSGINLSTVLIGPQSNSPFLMNLAQWGRGRFYAAPSRFQLPDLRFKEPQTTSMPAVQERPFRIEAAGQRESVAALADAERTLGGLVEARLRPGAEALLTVSDGGQPVLAGWDQGAGRTVVLATELLGPMADAVREQGWAALIADQVRALARGREAARPQLAVDARPDALRATVVDPGRPGWPNLVLTLSGDGIDPFRVSLTPDADGTFVVELPWPTDRPLKISVDELGLAAAAVKPLPRDLRLDDVSAELGALARATGGSDTGPVPTEPPTTAPEGRARAPLRGPLALLAIAAFLLAVLIRRWPGVPRVAATAVVVLGALLTTPAPANARAQQGPTQDPTDERIQQRIDEELRAYGNLDRLAEEWQGGTRAQRLALAHETGDLDAILALSEGAQEHRALRVLALDATGRLDDALALIREQLLDSGVDAMTRARWRLHEGELLLTLDPPQATAAAAAFRDAAALADDPAFGYAVGHLAAGYGLYEVGLALHVPPGDATDAERAATFLRRALWRERLDEVDGALAEYRAAADATPLRREERFALARQIALMKRHGRLQELVDEWSSDLSSLDSPHKAALLDALRDLEEGDAALALLARPELLDEPALQDQALTIAVECGRTDAAVESARTRLAADPAQPRLRVSLALLLTDLRRRADARSVLKEGMRIASRRELLLLIESASELGDEDALRTGLALLRARGEERDEVDAVLLEFQHLRRKQSNELAVQTLRDARPRAESPTAKVRLAEAFESAGRPAMAIELYREAWQATRTEDLALRLAWNLSNGDDPKEREESAALFREIWLNAGSAARRVQAEERVLDIAARDGTLADLAIELEEALEDPDTEHRDQKRDALVKIWARAQDTFGAREVLMSWAREQPEHEIDAWQRLAQVYLENEEFKNHERALRHLIDIDPAAELDYRQQLALGFLERGRPIEARAVIREMLDEDGSDPDAIAFEFSAGIFSLAGRHREAADLYRRALALHPDRIETLLLWANAMAAQDRGKEAVGRFVDILLQDVKDDLFLVAVDGLLNLDAPREAMRFAERALRRRIAATPDKVFLQRALQDVLEQLGSTAPRLESLEETVLIAGLQRTAWLRELMDESARRRDWQGYLRDARALLETGDEVPPAVFLEIGEALLKTDELRAAERAFARARLATDFAKVERRVAELFEKAGRLEDAERVLRRVLRRDPSDPGALIAVARLVEQRGDLADALGLYRDAAQRLFEGQDLDAEKPQQRGMSRNVTTTGPGFDEALEGVLRCATSRDDTEALRADLQSRLAAAKDASPQASLGLIAQMRRLATAWSDDAEAARLDALEDAVLAQEDGIDDALRLQVFLQRVARGDLDGAESTLTGLAEPAQRAPKTRLALLRGDADAALALLDEGEPRELFDAARTLQLLGKTDAVAELRARLQRLAEAAEGGDRAGAQLDNLKRLLGEPVDPRPRMDASLESARTAQGELRQRVGRMVSALRGHEFLGDAERGELLRPLVAETVRAKDGNAAWTILSAARTWLPADALAPLVPLLFDDQQQIYLVASRASFVDLLPTEEGTKVLRAAFARFSDAEVRSQLLRMVASGELPADQHRPMLSGLRLTELQPSDRTYLTRICCDAELPDETVGIIRRALERDLPKDPRVGILAARCATVPADRRDALRGAYRSLADEAQPDYVATQSIEKFAALADEELRAEILDRPLADDAPTGTLLLRSELLRAADRADAAADLLVAAVKRQPDNSLLLNRAQPLLQSLGRTEDAIALFTAYLDASAQVYPFQAGQLARLHLEQGHAEAALAALRRAEDDSGINLGILLRAAAQLEDPDLRAREVRSWVQKTQASRRQRGGVVMSIGAMERGTRYGPAAVLAASVIPKIAPERLEDAVQDGDVLAFLPEGAAAAEALLRGLKEEQRDPALALYRGMVGSAVRFGGTDEILARMRARVARAPFDAEALRIGLACAQVGIEVDGELLERAIAQRAANPRVDANVLIDLLWTARAAGREQLVARLLPSLLQDRGRLSSYQVRDRVGDVFQLAAELRPELLRPLAPGGGSPNVYFDGDLLAVLTLTDSDAAAIADGFEAVPRFLSERKPNHWAVRIALPWAGLCARRGDVDGAVEALMVDDPQLESGDLFPPRCLAAAAPPLALWSDPQNAVDLGRRLAEQAARPLSAGRRGLLLRVGFLLAIRLEDAGRTDDAAALRADLAQRVGEVPFVRAWLEDGAR